MTTVANNPSTDASALTQRWRPGFGLAANEERVVTYHFLDGSDGATKGINNQLNLRKYGVSTSNTLATTYVGSTDLTFAGISPSVVTLTPTFDYSAVELALNLLSRIDDEQALQTALKKQLMAALATTFDVAGANLATSLVTNIRGSGTNLADKATIFDALNAVVVSAKDHYKVGETKAHIVLYNRQCKNLWNIAEFTQAYMRGDELNPITRGWVSEAMNCTIEESGNIFANAGVAHNLVFVDDAFAYAFNLKPMLLDPQPFQAVIRLIAVQERGQAIYFDEYACDMQTTSA